MEKSWGDYVMMDTSMVVPSIPVPTFIWLNSV